MNNADNIDPEEVKMAHALYAHLVEYARRQCDGQPLIAASAVATAMSLVAGHVTQWVAQSEGCGDDPVAIEAMIAPLIQNMRATALNRKPGNEACQ